MAIRASYNVSSITDNGTGDYTVNFTNALTDASYCYSGSGSFITRIINVGPNSAVRPTASSLRVLTYPQANTSTVDPLDVTVAIIR